MVKKKESTESKDEEENVAPESTPEVALEELSKLRHGVVLTGGIDSTVLLYHVKNTMPDIDIYPIILGSNTEKIRESIKYFLHELGIKREITTFGKTDEIGMLTWAEKHQVSPIHFGANYDEGQHNINNFDYYQTLNDHNPNVVISTPLASLPKLDILRMAIKYNIDLSKTAKPDLNDKLKEIRKEAFRLVNVGRMKDKEGNIIDPIIDPYSDAE